MDCPLFQKPFFNIQTSKEIDDVPQIGNRRPFVSYKRFHPNYKTTPIVQGSEQGCIEHIKCTTLHYILPFQKAATTNKNLNNLESKLFQSENQSLGKRSNSVKRSRFSAVGLNKDRTRHFSNIKHIYPNENYGRSITVSTHRGRPIFKTTTKSRLSNRSKSKPKNNTNVPCAMVSNKAQCITSTPFPSKVQLEETTTPKSDENGHIGRDISPKLDCDNQTFVINSSDATRSPECTSPLLAKEENESSQIKLTVVKKSTTQSIAPKKSNTNKNLRFPKSSSPAKPCDKNQKNNTNSNKDVTLPKTFSPPKLPKQEKEENIDEQQSAGSRVVNWLSYQYFRPIESKTENRSTKSIQSCTNTSKIRSRFIASKRAKAYIEAQSAKPKNSYFFLTQSRHHIPKPYQRRKKQSRPEGHMSQFYKDKLKQSASCHSDISGYTEVGDHFYIRRSQIDFSFDYNRAKKSAMSVIGTYKNSNYQSVNGRYSCPSYFHNLQEMVKKVEVKRHRRILTTMMEGIRSCKKILF